MWTEDWIIRYNMDSTLWYHRERIFATMASSPLSLWTPQYMLRLEEHGITFCYLYFYERRTKIPTRAQTLQILIKNSQEITTIRLPPTNWRLGYTTRCVCIPVSYVKILTAVRPWSITCTHIKRNAFRCSYWNLFPCMIEMQILRMAGRKFCELKTLLWMCLFRAVPDTLLCSLARQSSSVKHLANSSRRSDVLFPCINNQIEKLTGRDSWET
jgi:hypothetical protein